MSDYDKEIEEAARKYAIHEVFGDDTSSHFNDTINDFKAGAKWQAQKDAERIKELEGKLEYYEELCQRMNEAQCGCLGDME